MVPGDIVGGRFQLDHIAGLGGMGTVFQARDLTTTEPVAVKVLFESHLPGDGRFEREAQLLSELIHPGLVRYRAHGVAATGERYLVMEWLEGEDLSRRLGRGRLGIEESVTMCNRVAEALAAVHARSVVHRDLKPSNIFLVGTSLEDVRILDFGVARFASLGGSTQTGTVLGTPGYMAPEQARSGQSIDSRVDVFALGAVLFEALTGTAAFAGTHLMAMLAKILFEDAPRVSDLRPEVPDALDALVARMLAKNPDERPRDGAAVARAITSLSASLADVPRSSRRDAPRSLTGGELRLLSVVLLGQVGGSDPVLGRVQSSRPPAYAGVADRRMRDIAEARGGRFERLADGSALVTIAGTTRIAADQAAHAARCALALHAAVPGRPLALATGRAAVTGRMPVGEAIDRAARLLDERGASARESAIAIDDVTAGLLDARFDVQRGAAGFTLHGERANGMGPRTLLGATTACVGRDREIATLNAMFVESVEGPSAQAVLVTAPAGTGKSRLVHEALRTVRRWSAAQGEAPLATTAQASTSPPAAPRIQPEIWMGRGDSLRVGSTFSVLGQALRAGAGMGDGEPLTARQQKLRARVALHVPPSEQRRVTEFLGEIVGTPFPDDDSVPLRAARHDALLMGEQMRRAFEDFIRAETAAQPLILVFEDLQWGDLPSVRFADHALRSLRDCPLMVIGVARPEVHELFPRLWEDRGVEEMRLKELSVKASERLVRQVLGDDADRATVSRVVAQAEGHAFFLEELIRAVAEGRGDTLPETVRATVEGRLEGLESDARRILRAASIYGGTFSAEGVGALLGPGSHATRTEPWLATLVDREVLVRRPDALHPREPEYLFRHAILREAAYAMLTDGDRLLGHRLAAEWLEGRGEVDAMALAEHLERAQLPERAGSYYLTAAQRALRGDDVMASVHCARRGLTCDVSPAVRVALLGVLCEGYSWRREWAEAEPFAEEVMRLAPIGSEAWAQAAPARLSIAFSMGRIDDFLGTLDLLQTVEPAPGAAGMVAFGLSAGAFILAGGGRFGLSTPVLRRLEAIVGPIADRDPIARAWMELTQAFHNAWADDAPALALGRARAAERGFREAGHTRGAAIAQVLAGLNEWCLGRLFEAERDLRATARVNDEDLGIASAIRSMLLVGVLADMGALAEARSTAARIVERGRARGQVGDEGRGRWLLADVLRRCGELEAAEREVTPSIDLLTVSPLDQAAAIATLAAVLLDRGRTVEALAAAHSAVDRYEVMGAFGYRGSFARLVLVEALFAAGQMEEARTTLLTARARLLARAAAIPDPESRRSFLHAVPENARTLALARDRLGLPEAPAPPSEAVAR